MQISIFIFFKFCYFRLKRLLKSDNKEKKSNKGQPEYDSGETDSYFKDTKNNLKGDLTIKEASNSDYYNNRNTKTNYEEENKIYNDIFFQEFNRCRLEEEKRK